MEAAQEFIESVLGTGLRSDELEARHVVARAIAVYVAVLVIVRLGKRRFMSGASAFDVILAIMLGAVASRAITGAAPFWTTLAGTAALMAMHWLFFLGVPSLDVLRLACEGRANRDPERWRCG